MRRPGVGKNNSVLRNYFDINSLKCRFNSAALTLSCLDVKVTFISRSLKPNRAVTSATSSDRNTDKQAEL